jgi:regulator of PEP synthase PpsR (kinase-PPPase family)
MAKKTRKQDPPLKIVIISGATGRTAQQVVQSALAQFADPNVEIITKKNVRSQRAATKIVREFAGQDVVLCHSLVSPEVRNAVMEEAKQHMIPNVDILGRVVAMLSDHLGSKPKEKPGMSYKLQKGYFDRIDAVSFTLDHDDGARPDTLDKADVVIVGVSRVSKSVTCFYLAYRGIRAANVPIIPGYDLPEKLLTMPKEKVIGLIVNPGRLKSVREVRQDQLGAGQLDYYVDRADITRELRYAQEVIDRYGWRCLDVSYMAVEEVAREVMKMIGKAQ